MPEPTTGRRTADDGVAIVHHRWGADHSGPPVVLLHGFLSHTKLNWQVTGVVDALLDAGRWVLGIDARGHGDSDKPHDPASYGQQRMARDVGMVLDGLGVGGFDLAGYSMGALVAAEVAAGSDRVGRLVLGGVGAAAVEHGTWDIATVPQAELVAALRAEDPDDIDHGPARSFRAFADRSGADRLALAAAAEARTESDIDFGGISATTLVLAGRDDPLAERPGVLADAIPEAEIEHLEGDHLGATRDERFPRAIADFLG